MSENKATDAITILPLGPKVAPEKSPQVKAFHQMRAFATGLFIFMACVFLFARYVQHIWPIFAYVRAFAEAAVVGALADWFAVTALFRHPLGLPIPHTAIVPRSKDRIGAGLGNFISSNFLAPDLVEKRLASIDLAGAAAQWLGTPARVSALATAIAGAIPRLLGAINDVKIGAFLENTITEQLRKADLASLAADALDLLTRHKRHKPIVDLIIHHAELTAIAQEDSFRATVSKRTEWFGKIIGLDHSAANSLVDAIKEILHDAAIDPNHALRGHIDKALANLVHDLRLNPNLREQVKQWVADFSAHETIANYVRAIWTDVKESMMAADENATGRIAALLEDGLNEAAQALNNDPDLRESLNQRLKSWAVELAANQGARVGDIVADTIRNWDGQTVVSQIENAVGRDLQYIRINGTVIGGLVGLLMHIILGFFDKF